MRDIKFRAWYCDDKYQLESQMLFVGDSKGTTHPLDCCSYLLNGQPVTLMQYTGLKDTNGKEIYEGDIVAVSGVGLCEVFIDTLLGVMFSKDVTAHDCIMENDTIIIKGNIYENPDLLENKK